MRVLRDARLVASSLPASGSVGFVPTMGALHDGHLTLVDRARADCDFVAASIFVNPLQFDDPADLAAYPRDEERDLALLQERGTDLVLCGETSDLYPEGYATRVAVRAPFVDELEGASRPGHFEGVATVVTLLFLLFRPTRAYFGWKDMQQCCLVQRLAADLPLGITIVPVEVVREPDGLALSSRNALLSRAERARAPRFHAALAEARELWRGGERRRAAILDAARQRLAADFDVDYVDLRQETDFAACPESVEEGRLVAVVRLGRVRLLDTLPLVPAGARG